MSDGPDLHEQIKDIESFQEAAPPRLKAYYSDGEPPDDRPAFDTPPHQLMVEDGADYIAFGAGTVSKLIANRTTVGDADSSRMILLAVGTELVLNGLYLKHDAEAFITDFVDNDGCTPGFDELKDQVMAYLPTGLTGEQRKRIRLVLELLHIKRNNLIHFALQRKSYSYHLPAIFEVLSYLIAIASDENLPTIEILHDRATEFRALNSGRELPPV